MPRAKFDPRIQLRCEWEACCRGNFNDNVHLFRKHVSCHAEREVRTQDRSQLTCLWTGCGETAFATGDHFLLHVSYHCYHTQLMSAGEVRLSDLSKKFDRHLDCHNDRSSRTSLPDIPDPFSCCWQSCQLMFSDAERFFVHVYGHLLEEIAQRKKEPSGSLLQCKWKHCSYEGKNRVLLSSHMRTHTLEKEIACPACGFMFSDNLKFDDHILRQVKLRPADLNAQSTASTSDETESPTKRTKISPELLQCESCKKLFLTSRLREEHRRMHCVIHTCDECGFVTESSDSLIKHKTYRHSDQRPFPCQFCESKFKFKRDLRKHLLVHNPESHFPCPECNFAARTADTLTGHIRRVHRNEIRVFSCHICQTEFSRGNNLSRHLTTSHRLRPPRGMVRFKYVLDSEEQVWRMMDMDFEEVLPGVNDTTQ